MDILSFENQENDFLKQLEVDKKIIMQRYDWDCGVATLATILDCNYEDVSSSFKPKSCNLINQLGLSYRSIKNFLEKSNRDVKLLIKNEFPIKEIIKHIESCTNYLVILKKNNGSTHFCSIFDKILYDPEQGVVVLDDELDFEDYLLHTNFLHFKYLTKVQKRNFIDK